MKISDIENHSDKVPKHFKQAFLGIEEEAYIIAGGFDMEAIKSSNKAFLLRRGTLTSLLPMHKGRQNFAFAVARVKRKPKDKDYNIEAYAIGGFSLKEGALNHIEKFNYDTQDWEERAPMNLKRINASACCVETATGNHLYVFGGRNDGDEFYDSVEKYSCDLNFWSMLEIKLPKKLCNFFVFPF